MADSSSSLIEQIVELSKIDVLIAGLESDRKKIEIEVLERQQAITALKTTKGLKANVLETKKGVVSREEKSVKIERDRINERRRTLSGLSDYKLQEAAEREIDFVAKQIGQREEVLLVVMREVELLEKDIATADTTLTDFQGSLDTFQSESKEKLDTIVARLAEYGAERSQAVSVLGAGNVAIAKYNRVRSKHPMDPIVSIVNTKCCGGCHMSLGPQPLVQVARGEIVQCPGCGRILKLEQSVEAVAA